MIFSGAKIMQGGEGDAGREFFLEFEQRRWGRGKKKPGFVTRAKKTNLTIL